MPIGVETAPQNNNEYHWVWGYDATNSKLRALACDPNGYLSTGDQQIAGVHDDGSASGVMKSKLVSGGLVKIPFRSGEVSAITNGTGTSSYQSSGYGYNEDGSGILWQVTAGTGLGNSAGIRWNFTGKILGIRWWRKISGNVPFYVTIDGVNYPVYQVNSANMDLTFPGTTSDNECCYIVADDLPDTNPDGTPRIHTGSVIVPSQLGGGAAAISFFGYMVESRVGYEAKPRCFLPVTGTLTNAAAQLSSGPSADQVHHAIRKVLYCNIDVAVNATSTITYGAGVNGGTIKLTAGGGAQTAAITWSGTNATLLANIQAALITTFGVSVAGVPNVVPTAVSLTAGIGTILLTAQGVMGSQPITWTLQDSSTGGTASVASTTTGATGAHTVTIQMSINGNTAVTAKKIYLTAAGTKGDSDEIDFGDRLLGGSCYKHLADANSVVQFSAIASY